MYFIDVHVAISLNMTKNSRYIQFKINHLLDVHEFNNIQLKKEEL